MSSTTDGRGMDRLAQPLHRSIPRAPRRDWRAALAAERIRTVESTRSVRAVISGIEGDAILETLRAPLLVAPTSLARLLVRWEGILLPGAVIVLVGTGTRLIAECFMPHKGRSAAAIYGRVEPMPQPSRRAQVAPVSSTERPRGASVKAAPRKTGPARRKAARARVARRARAAAAKGSSQ